MSSLPFNHTFFHIATNVPDSTGNREDEDGFPHPVRHRPIGVSLMRISKGKDVEPDIKISSKVIKDPKDEKPLVEQFFHRMPGGSGFVVSYMGRPFTLPVMVYAALRHGVDASEYLKDERAFTARYSKQHIDLADFLSGYGAVTQHASLTDFAKIIGFAKRVWLDVPKAFAAGDTSVIKDRLEIDVMLIAAIYLRLMFSQARLGSDAYQLVAKSMLHSFFDRSALIKNYLKKSDVKGYLNVDKRKVDDAKKKSK